MNYRQWKKKYKKEHGHNPPIEIDERKRVKAARKLYKIMLSVDFTKLAKAIGEATQTIAETLEDYARRVEEQLKIAAKEIKEISKATICEQPDCINCPFPQCEQSYVDKCIKECTEREKKENEKEMQKLR